MDMMALVLESHVNVVMCGGGVVRFLDPFLTWAGREGGTVKKKTVPMRKRRTKQQNSKFHVMLRHREGVTGDNRRVVNMGNDLNDEGHDLDGMGVLDWEP